MDDAETGEGMFNIMIGKFQNKLAESRSNSRNTIERKPNWNLKFGCKPPRLVSLISSVCLLTYAPSADAEVLDVRTFIGVAQRCGSTVAAQTLAAIAKTESRFQTLVVADNSTRVSHIYQTLDEAASVATNLVARGDSVDLGLMQINSANLRRLGMTVRDAFNPCRAIRAAASIMTGNFLASRRAGTQQIALRNALSMYNTGNAVHGYRNGYVHKVEVSARSLAGFFDTSLPLDLRMRSAQDVRNMPLESEQADQSWDVWRRSENPQADYKGVSSAKDISVL